MTSRLIQNVLKLNYFFIGCLFFWVECPVLIAHVHDQTPALNSFLTEAWQDTGETPFQRQYHRRWG